MFRSALLDGLILCFSMCNKKRFQKKTKKRKHRFLIKRWGSFFELREGDGRVAHLMYSLIETPAFYPVTSWLCGSGLQGGFPHGWSANKKLSPSFPRPKIMDFAILFRRWQGSKNIYKSLWESRTGNGRGICRERFLLEIPKRKAQAY